MPDSPNDTSLPVLFAENLNTRGAGGRIRVRGTGAIRELRSSTSGGVMYYVLVKVSEAVE